MAFFNQIADALTLCSQPSVRHVRTTADPPMAPEEAMKLLKDEISSAILMLCWSRKE